MEMLNIFKKTEETVAKSRLMLYTIYNMLATPLNNAHLWWAFFLYGGDHAIY